MIGKFVKICTAFAIVLLCLPSSIAAASTNKYTLEASLNYERAYVEVRETVVFTNRTTKQLASVVFNVTPAHFRAFSLKSASVDNVPVETRLDGETLELPLPKPLAPREAATIVIEFSLDIPQQGGRFGINEGVLSLGNWYPVLAVFKDREGWSKPRYTTFGDPFFTEVADYDVLIKVQSNVKIAHSGELVSREGDTWRFSGKDIRDFALAISTRYETRSIDIDDTKVTVFYLPEHRPAGSLYLDAAARAVQWLNQRVAPAPYRSLHIAEVVSASTEMVGQEYSGLAFISSSMADKASGLKSPLGYLVVHEVVHQWFYSSVGNDQIYEPWLDEAMATYLSYQILDMPALTLSSPAVVASGNSPVNSSIYDFRDEGTYSATVYGKGTVFLQELSATLGSEKFFPMLQNYTTLFRNKIATSHDFFSLAQSYSAKNLNPLFRKYFSLPEYKGDAVPRLAVKWPDETTWKGATDIEFEADTTLRKVTIDADGYVLASQDGPSSPMTIDTSQLEDGEYVVRIVAKDANGNIAQQMRRVNIANPRPTPTPLPKSIQQPEAYKAPERLAREINSIAALADRPEVREYGFYGFAAMLGLFVVAVIAIKALAGPRVSIERLPRLKKDQSKQAKAKHNEVVAPSRREISSLEVRPLDPRPSGERPSGQPAILRPIGNQVSTNTDSRSQGCYGAAELVELEATADIKQPLSATSGRHQESHENKQNTPPYPTDFQPRER